MLKYFSYIKEMALNGHIHLWIYINEENGVPCPLHNTSAALLFLYASLFPMNYQFFFRQPLTSSNCRTLSLPHFFLVVDDIVEL